MKQLKINNCFGCSSANIFVDCIVYVQILVYVIMSLLTSGVIVGSVIIVPSLEKPKDPLKASRLNVSH